ncbi:hypothetical protein ALT_0918 [Aspergillus lentulus]|uniref:Proteasome assembly chaperone 3 n=1 Tax=Aspergillus lentulus TaxID=293939 RepID=A0AAN4PBP1_ASPLE|nr:hypothetical protein ALT_0918 [Aspergillus lentulus]
MSNLLDLDNLQVPLDLPFPAGTKQVAGVVNGIQTDVTCVQFSDKILVTISQNGRLGHWLHVPLENKNPGAQGFHTLSESVDDDLLPMSRLMATSLLGGRAPGHETVGQLYARQIASAIATKTPDEKRLLIVGLGLESAEADREVFFAIIDLKKAHNKSESPTQIYRDFFLLCSCSDPLDRQIGNSERKDELSQAFRLVFGQASEYQPSEKFNPATKQSADQISLIKSGDFPLISGDELCKRPATLNCQQGFGCSDQKHDFLERSSPHNFFVTTGVFQPLLEDSVTAARQRRWLTSEEISGLRPVISEKEQSITQGMIQSDRCFMVKHVRGPEDRQIPDLVIIWTPYLDITVVVTEQEFINSVSDLDRQTKKVTSQVPVAHDKTAPHHLATLIDSYILEGFRFSWLDKIGGSRTLIIYLPEELHQQSE